MNIFPRFMYKRSPILRAALSPRANDPSENIRGERLQAEINRIRVLANLNGTAPFEKPVLTPVTATSSPDTELSIYEEIEKTQSAVTELVSLFHNFRSSVDSRLQSLADSVHSRIVEERLRSRGGNYHRDWIVPKSEELFCPSMEQKNGMYGEVAPDIEVQRLKEELKLLREDHDRLNAKVKRINELNCETHIRSSIAIKKVRDLIND